MRNLIEKISEGLLFDINEKLAIIYLFDVLSANMLNKQEYDKHAEENTMLIHPGERYMKKKAFEQGFKQGFEQGKLETAKNMIKKVLR